MPTLIRFFVIVLVLAGLAYGGMVALTTMVVPKEREVTLRIPSRELLKAPERAPIARREINTNRTPAAPAPGPASAPAQTAPAVEPAPAEAPADGPVKTLSPGDE